jgi:hypothetical protein
MSSTLSGPRSSPGTAAALVVGPALLLAGVLLMPAPGAWMASHLIFLTGTLAMLPAGVVLHRLLRDAAPPWMGRSALALTVAGSLALAGQFVIDLVVLRLAAGDRETAGAMFDLLQGSPAFALTFYTVGPALLFTGLAVSGAAMLVRSGPRHRPGWALIGGTLVMGAARIAGARPGEVAGLALLLAALALTACSAGAAAGEAGSGPERVNSRRG